MSGERIADETRRLRSRHDMGSYLYVALATRRRLEAERRKRASLEAERRKRALSCER